MTEQENDKKGLPATTADKATPAEDSPTEPSRNDGDTVTRNRTEGQGKLPLILALVAIVVAVGMAVTAYFTWREVARLADGQQQGQQQLVSRSEGVEARLQDTARRMDGIQAEVDRSLNEARREQRSEMKNLQAQQQAVEDSVALIRAQMGRSQDGWLLAEVEYLLRIGNQRLQLQRDVPTALAALMAADERLQGLADPGYLPVRKALAQEMEALRSAPPVDMSGVALKLATLGNRVDDLPLAGARYVPADERMGERPAAGVAEDWREVPKLIWGSVKDLVAIRNASNPATPMLPPEQQYFLQQNLRLVLESARLALLQSDPDNYRVSLETARRWVLAHFDQDDAATMSMRDELDALLQKDIRPQLPDISASLRLLRQHLRLKQNLTESKAETLPATGKPKPVTGSKKPLAEKSRPDTGAVRQSKPVVETASDTPPQPPSVPGEATVTGTINRKAADKMVNEPSEAPQPAATVPEGEQ